MSALTFHNQVAVVTGGSGSIGHLIVAALAERGANVVAGYHQHDVVVNALQKTFSEQVLPVQADLREPDAGQLLVDTALSRWNRLDILITAHSMIANAPVAEMSLEQWHAVLQVMLRGTMGICRAALRPMQRARYGRIVTLTGYQPLAGALDQANYAAALGGVLGFGKALAREVAAWGININSVAPGLIERAQIAAFDPSYVPWATNIVPLKRLGKPNEVVPTVLLLASEAASYMTGQTIMVEGGWRMV